MGHHSLLHACNLYPTVNINNAHNISRRGTLVSNTEEDGRKISLVVKDMQQLFPHLGDNT